MVDRICILYDSRCPASAVAARYCVWVCQTVWNAAVHLCDTAVEPVPILLRGSDAEFTAVLLLSILDGDDRLRETDWEQLCDANGIIPLFAFYKAAFVIARNPRAAALFGPIKEQQIVVGKLEPALLNFIEPAINRAARRLSGAEAAEPLVMVRGGRFSDNKRSVLASAGEDAVVYRVGCNVFDGQLRVVESRMEFPLDGGRASLFLRQLVHHAKRFRTPPVLPERPVWPVCLRMDDPPASWWQLRRSEPIFKSDDYRRLVEVLKRHGAKLTLMCVPAAPQGRQAVPWWKCAPQMQEIWRHLHDGVAAGCLEIGCHGLTHLTIGRRMPSRARERFNRWRNPWHNPTREFYDDMRRQAIPLTEQRRAIRASIDLLEGFFKCRVRCFTPGAHNWDDDTERAAAAEGIQFFCADTTWTRFLPGGPLCKNPAPLGQTAQSDARLLYVSRLLAWPVDKADVDILHELGVPLTISSHNYGSTAPMPEALDEVLGWLNQYTDRKYTTVSELGDWLLTTGRAATGPVVAGVGSVPP